LWEEYKLKESDINIYFNVPSHFAAVREQQLLEIKTKNVQNLLQSADNLSKTYAIKKYLNWTDEELKVNREWLKKDAALAWEIQQITSLGSNWKEALTTGSAAAGMPGAPGGGPGIPGIGGPPSFGPGPGGGAPEAPEGGGPGEVPGAPGGAAPTPVPSSTGSALPGT